MQPCRRSSSPLIGQAACIGDGKPYNIALIALYPDAAAGKSASDPATIAEIVAGVEFANSHFSLSSRSRSSKSSTSSGCPGATNSRPR
ncbi:hypothetical protein [Rhodococcus sp. DK17]|uniref:hypothetical protein n=1 Tax=Rhodococcus sp. DK17 TaxID=186196 RepID=UPI003FD2109B